MTAAAEYCDLCGQPATASRHNSGTIAVCTQCALDVLPGLVADAIDMPGREAENKMRLAAERMLLGYWRAAALRLAREHRR